MNSPLLQTSPPKRSPWKKTILLTSICVLSLGVAVGLAPTFLSSSWGASYIAKKVGVKTNGKLQIQSLSLSWLGTQEIEGISYSDNAGILFASCERIATDSSLIAILFGEHQIGDLTVTSPHLKIKKEFISCQKISSPQIVESSLVYIPPLTPVLQKMLFPFSGRITIKEGAIDVTTNGIDPIYMHDIECTAFFARDKSRISLNLQASSTQHNETGKISFDGELLELHTINPKLTIQSSVSNLPIKVLDQITSLITPDYKGILVDALGQNLSLTLNGTLSRTNIDLQLSANSQNLQAEISTLSNGLEITLKAPAKISLTLSPELVHRFLPGFSSQTASTVNIAISSIRLPISDTGVDLQQMEIHSQASLSPMPFKSSSIGPVVVNIDSKALQTELTFSLSSPLQSVQNSSQIMAKGSASGLFTADPTASISFQLAKVPSSLIDALSASPYGTAVLGSTIDATAKLDFAQQLSHLYFSIQTPTLTIKNAHWTIGDVIQLQEPFTSTFSPSDELYARLFPDGEVIAAPSHPLQFNIENCVIPSFSDLSKISMRATLQTSLLSYKKAFTFSPYVIENLSSDILISTFEDISINLESSLFAINFQGAWREKESTLVCKKPILLTYLLTDEQIASLLHSDERLYLENPTPLHAQIEPTTLRFAPDMLSTTILKGKVSVDNILLQNKDASRQTSLEKTSLSFDFQGPGNELNAKILGSFTKESANTSKIEASLKASSFLQNGSISPIAATLSSDVLLQDVPTSLIQMLAVQELPLPSLIGPTFNLIAHVDMGASSHEIMLDAKSTYMQLQSGISIKDGIISLHKAPCHASITLTPESYLVLDNLTTKEQKSPPFTLSEKTTFAFTISELNMPYSMTPCGTNNQDTCLHIDVKNTVIVGSLDNSLISFADTAAKQAILLKSTHLSFQKLQGVAPVRLQMATEANTTSSKQLQSGTLQINAELSNIFSETGSLDFSHLSSKADVSIQKLPSSSLDLFARSFGSNSSTFSSVFGPSVTATLSLTLQDATGPIKANINSPSTRASLAGKLTNGVLTLSEPIYAQITMTEELSKLLLGGVNPLSITEIKSKNPITLEVQPAGFSLPLTSFAINKVNIPTARIELGQISCKNEGNLNIALSLLKSVQVSQNKTLNLWFTPIDLHINQGVVNVERTEILIAETFDIALWGLIDPVKNNVNMVLGLTSDCLAKAFSITNLPEDYVLQIPMTGTLNNVEINKTKATAKIAALLAWQQAAIAGEAAGGPAGAIFGHFLNKLGSLPLNDQDTPPAKRPFPWETREPSKPKESKKKETSQRYKKAHIKKEDKPLKQIWKLVR